MLNIVCGPFSPGLEESLIESIQTLKRDDPLAPVAVVTPSQSLRRHLEMTLAGSLADDQALFNITFSTLNHLRSELVRETGKRIAIMDDAVFMGHFLHTVLQLEPEGFPLLRSSITSPRLARSLYQTLRDLKDAGVDPENALQALQEKFLGDDDPEKLDELFRLYRSYTHLQERYAIHDQSDAFKHAAAQAPESPYLKQFQAIFIYGFYDFTGTQLDFLRAVTGNHPATLFFPCVKDDPDYGFAQDFLTQFLGGADRVTWLPDKRVKTDAKPIRILHTSGTADEAWAAAKQILMLTEKEGVAVHDIAVVARTLDRYRDVLPTIFQDHGIPFTMNPPEPVSVMPPIHALIQFLSLPHEPFARSTVLDLISSPHFKISGGDLRPDLIDLLTRKLGIGRGLEMWRQRLEPWTTRDYVPFPSRKDDDDVATTAVPKEQTLQLLTALNTIARDLDALPASASCAEFGRAMRRLIGTYFRLQDDTSDILETALSSLESLDQIRAEVSRDDYLELLIEKLTAMRVRPNPPPTRGVRVLDVMSARGIPFKAIVVLGMNEKIFPRFILEDPHLRDATRARLSFTLGVKILEKLRGYNEERLLFRMLMDNARDQLHLIYQRSDEEGKVQIPSIYMRTMRHPREAVPRSILDKMKSVDPTFRTPKETTMTLAMHNEDVTPLIKAAGRDVERYTDQHRILALLEQSESSLTPMDGIVGTVTRWAARMKERGLSPTNIQTLAECPFKYFATKLLRLEEPSEPDEVYEIDSLKKGTLVHAILEAFYKTAHPADASLLERSAEAAFARYEQHEPINYPLLWEFEKQTILKRLKVFLKRDLHELRESGFVPKFLEAPVSGPITLGGATVSCHGIVDRIDVRESDDAIFVRVIDYKTGRVKEEKKLEKEILEGKKLQLPLYMPLAKDMIQKQGPTKPVTISESRYVHVMEEDPDLMIQAVTPEMALDLAPDIGTKISFLYRLAAEGAFFIVPNEFAQCKYCPLTQACRKNHSSTMWRTYRSPARQEYDKILHPSSDEKDERETKTDRSRRPRKRRS